MVAWPATLPDFVWMNMSGAFGEGRRITPTDSGFTQLSVLTRNPRDPMEVSFEVTGAQMQTLRTFYKTTLVNGTLPFTWGDPFNGTFATYQFAASAGPPQWQRIRSGRDAQGFNERFYTISFTLEQLP
jgi:hypothetical protein